MRARLPILLAVLLPIGGAAQDRPAIPREAPSTLQEANAATIAAARAAARLEARAAVSEDPAVRARWERAAVAARVRGAEAELAAARLRIALVEAQIERQRATFAAEQGPIAGLLAMLTGLARRPAVVALAQPGSVTDLVHVQAVLGATLPVVAARTVAIRDELARSRALGANAAIAARSLESGHARLLDAREQLAVLSGDEDRAMALGERSRDVIDELRTIGTTQATLADLATLPGPPVAAASPVTDPGAYRLPVAGRLATGMGEVSRNGVRARGLTFVVAPGAPVTAPAAGRIVYAGAFRSFGGTVIVDHGDGWTTLVTGLGRVAVARGAAVTPGAPIGRAADGDAPQVTVELRRRGRAMDLIALLG